MKTCIFVFGMHRSGTSALSGSLVRCGYDLGRSTMGKSPSNPKGHYENIHVFRINETAFQKCGVRWDYWPAHYSIALGAEDLSMISREIKRFIQEDFTDNSKIIIKDPRLSILLPLWVKVLSDLGYSSKFIISFRQPLQIFQSLHRRDGFSFAKSSLLFVEYLLGAEKNSRHGDRYFINYEDLLSEKSTAIKNILTNVNLPVPDNTDVLWTQIDSFIEKRLDHHQEDDISSEFIPKMSFELYELLCNWRNILSNSEALEDLHKRLKASKKISFYADEKVFELINKNKSNEVVLDELRREHNMQKKTLSEIANQLDSMRREQVVILLAKEKEFRSNEAAQQAKHQQLMAELNLKEEIIKNLEYKLEVSIAKGREQEQAIEARNLKIKDQNERISLVNERLDKVEQKWQEDHTRFQELIHKSEQEVMSFKSELDKAKVIMSNQHTKNHQLETELQNYQREYHSLKTSISSRLGFALTAIPRGVLTLIKKLMDQSTVWWISLSVIFIRHPMACLKMFNITNFRHLWFALRNENKKTLLHNIKKRLTTVDGLIEQKKGEADHDLYYNLDETAVLGNKIILKGWVVSKFKIQHIYLTSEKKILSEIELGHERTDVAAVYKDYPGSDTSGFYFFQDFNEPTSQLSLRIVGEQGTMKEVGIELRTLTDYSTLGLNEQYQIFLQQKASRDQSLLRAGMATPLDWMPLISIITPVYNTDPKWLDRCAQSVLSQSYGHWEWCLYDDRSTHEDTLDYLKTLEERDPRIHIRYGKKNLHISGASNKAIEMATGEYVGLLDHDDELSPSALDEVAKVINANPQLDLIYSDEDKIDKDGYFIDPHFKSDFNLDMIRSNNYICHFLVIKTSKGHEVGWFIEGFEGSQDHDLILRIIDSTSPDHIFHIPKVLYHWRKIEGSTALQIGDKEYAIDAGIRSLESHLKRNNLVATVEKGHWPGSYRVRYKIPNPAPKVSIIIPFKNQYDLLKQCVESLLKKTIYPNFEILLVSNNSDDPKTIEYAQTMAQNDNIQFSEYNIPFNYSKINNWAVERTTGELILLLNNDTMIIEKGWLKSMVELILRPEVGAVGAKLLYDDDSIQHAGVIIGLGGVAGHSHKNLPDDHSGYFFRPHTIQNLSACTAACLLIKKDVFQEVNGFNEEELKVAFNDVDLCLRIRQKGYLISYTPYATLYHFESKSRGYENTPVKINRVKGEIAYFKQTWHEILDRGDPYYNHNLTLDREDFSLALSSPVELVP